MPGLLHVANPLGQQLPVVSEDRNHLLLRDHKRKALVQEDYPRIKFWFESDWKVYRRDKKAASNDTSITSDYMEDEDGCTVPDRRKGEIREVAASLWFEMVAKGQAPARWSAAPADVKEFFYNGMNLKCEEMRYCHNDWKSQHLATMNYSSFYSNHGQKGPSMAIKQESDEGRAVSNDRSVKRGRSDGDKDKAKKKRRAEGTGSVVSLDLLLNPIADKCTAINVVTFNSTTKLRHFDCYHGTNFSAQPTSSSSS